MGLNPIRITTSIQADQGTVDFDFPFGRRAKPSLIRFIPYLFNAIIIYSSCYKRLFLGGGALHVYDGGGFYGQRI